MMIQLNKIINNFVFNKERYFENKKLINEFKFSGLFLIIGCTASHVVVPTLVIVSGMVHDQLPMLENTLHHFTASAERHSSVATTLTNTAERMCRNTTARSLNWGDPFVIQKWEIIKDILLTKVQNLQEHLVNILSKRAGITKQEYSLPFTVCDSYRKFQAHSACAEAMGYWQKNYFAKEGFLHMFRIMKIKDPSLLANHNAVKGFETFLDHKSKEVLDKFFEKRNFNLKSTLSIKEGFEDQTKLKYQNINRSRKEVIFCAATVVAIGLIVNQCFE